MHLFKANALRTATLKATAFTMHRYKANALRIATLKAIVSF